MAELQGVEWQNHKAKLQGRQMGRITRQNQ